ncbi:YjfB family protein [Thermohalobacter berrensis]|uniref:Motility protein n=1 Tax=Thermohalobacter berrensis TaxID=99594 RepID=A0A419T4F5_9FIRM|nr:YjfB family protein [Thermohalobacter berrensis]RKD32342.1 hypothetical protein BET03_03270 [Thermohalobacter berrensis]
MKISSYMSQNIYSLKQALGMATLRKAMNQDAQSVANIMKSVENINKTEIERSVNPHVGGNIDIKV